jgi:Ca-activated chloride channel family protein
VTSLRCRLLFVRGGCLLTLLFLSVASTAQQSPSGAPRPFTFDVSVNEVVLHATVHDRRGTPVAGLNKENFQIFENGALQTTHFFSHQDIPVSVGLVIDNSGSMRQKRAEVVAAALAFANSSNPQDQMFLVNFNEHVSFGLPREMPFTDSPNQLRGALGSVRATGETALFDAVIAAIEHLKQGNRDKKVLIVVSDGADNASMHKKAEMLERAKQSDAIVYAVGIYDRDDPDRSPQVLTELAKSTGGEAWFPAELREVTPLCEQIAREIREQYTLSYVPLNSKKDGTYRRIAVRAESPGGRGLSVITRGGYTAATSPVATAVPESRPEARK